MALELSQVRVGEVMMGLRTIALQRAGKVCLKEKTSQASEWSEIKSTI
jgi:hypothetical protein